MVGRSIFSSSFRHSVRRAVNSGDKLFVSESVEQVRKRHAEVDAVGRTLVPCPATVVETPLAFA